MTVTGHAYLDRTAVDRDTLVAMAVIEGPDGPAAFVRQYRRQ